MSRQVTFSTSFLGRTARSDRLLQAFLGLSVLLCLPFLARDANPDWLARYSRATGFLTLGAAIMIVAASARGHESPRERRFWYLISAALGALWIAGGAGALSSTSAGLPWLVMTDALYVVFFLLLAMAALSPPDRSRAWSQRLKSVEVFGLVLTLLGFLTYFVLVPSSYATQTYRSSMPSMYLFVVLDLLLVFLFARLVGGSECPRWRVLFSSVVTAAAAWAVLDGVETLGYAGWLSVPYGGPIDLLWSLPILTLVIAARAAFVSRGSGVEDVEAGRTTAPKLANVALVGTISFPLIHLLLSSFDIVDPALRGPREVVVLASVVALGIVAFLERAQVQVVRWQEQRKREAAEAALRDSEMRYRHLVENAPEAIVIFDQDSGRFVDANYRALDMFKVSREELLRRGPLDFSPAMQPDGRLSGEVAPAQLERAMAGDNASFEWVHKNALGEEVHCEVFLTAYPWEGRKLVRGCLIDITKQIVLREQLRQSQRMESIGQLAGGVAHDFNNLLTVITGYCDLVLDRPGLDAGLRHDIEEVRSAGDSAAALTSQLLAFSRRQVLKLEAIDLNRVVENMREMLARLVGEDLRLVVELDPELRHVLADQGQVEQTLMNLAANARDAMPAGGLLALETSMVEVRAGDLSRLDAKPGLYGQLTVSDTGSGMDAATRERVFEPFFTTKTLGHGTGLGLATVYGIVAQSGGFIEVDSTPGEGSRFAVHFPLAQSGSVSASSGARTQRLAPRGEETILLVEDEKAVRDLLCTGLESFGYRVLTAADGERALDMSARLGPSQIDVLVSDVVLPGKNGPQVAREILALRPEIKVIYISGYTDDLLASKGETAEGDSFLQKPFTALRLATEIRAALRERLAVQSHLGCHAQEPRSAPLRPPGRPLG